MPLLDLLTSRLPGTLRIRDGNAFATGSIATLPTCNLARRGEERRVPGGAGVADAFKVCEKTAADTYAWTAVTPITTATNLTVNDGGVLVDATVSTLTFDASDFTVTEPVEDEALIALAYGTTAGTPAEGNHSHATGYTVGPWVFFFGKIDTALSADREWTNMPLASTELLGGTTFRREIDLTNITEAFFVANPATAGSANAVLNLEYTTDLTGATGWASIGTSTLSIAGTGYINSGWDAISGSANAVVLLRVMGSGGNGTADPVFLDISVQFRGVGVTGPAGSTGATGATGATGSGSLVDVLLLGGM